MYTNRDGLSGKPIHVSALRAAIAFALGAITGIGLGCAGLVNPTLPFLGLYWISIATLLAGVTSSLLAVRYWLLNRQCHFEFSWLSKSWFYTFVTGHAPHLNQNGDLVCPWRWKEPLYVSSLLAPVGRIIARLFISLWRRVIGTRSTQDGGTTDEPRHVRRWQVEWIPYKTTRHLSNVAGVEVVSFGKEFIPGRISSLHEARATWIKSHHPDRYGRVLAWWQVETKQMSREPAPHTPFWVEYLEGANVACEPTWWAKKLGHGCDFDPIARLQESLQKLPESQWVNVTPPPPLPTAAEATDFLYGKGYQWEQRHTQKYAWHRGFDQSEAGKSPDQGDARLYALGIREETMVFRPVSDWAQHGTIWGATGVGKTRLLEQFTDQIIRSGFPLLIIDPKGDEAWLDRTATAARESGRAHHFRYFNLVLPSNRNIATMNPMSHFNLAEHLGNRLGAVIADASDAYWKDKAMQVGRDVYAAVAACREFLRLLGRDRATGVLMHEQSPEVPLVLLAMQYAGSHPGCSPADAENAVREIVVKMRDPAWKPNGDQFAVVKLASMREYTPRFWCPAIHHVSFYALEKTTLFLGLLAKIAQFHAFMDVSSPGGLAARSPVIGKSAPPAPSAIPPFAAPDFALTAPADAITGNAGKGGKAPPMSLMQIYRDAGNHPLELRLGSVLPLNAAQEKWKSYYDYFVPNREGDDMAIAASFSRLNDQISTVTAFTELDRSDWLQQTSTLSAGLARFKGPVQRITCALTPDVTWKGMIEDSLIVYCSLGSLIDKDGAGGFAKMILSDLMSYAGEVYHYHQLHKTTPKPWFVQADEIGRWVNGDVVELLATGRGAGAHIQIAGQTRADVSAGLGNADRAKQFYSNTSTICQMRAAEEDDAVSYSTHCGKTTIIEKSQSNRLTSDMMGAGNKMIDIFSGDTTYSLSRKEVDLVPPEMPKKLPKGQVIISAMGGETYLVAIGMFPATNVSIKEQYGTLDDMRDREAAMRTAKEIEILTGSILEQQKSARSQQAVPPSPTQIPLPPRRPPPPTYTAPLESAHSDQDASVPTESASPTSSTTLPPPSPITPSVPPRVPLAPAMTPPRKTTVNRQPPFGSLPSTIPRPVNPPTAVLGETAPTIPPRTPNDTKASTPDSTVALPGATSGSIHPPQIPTARPDRSDSVGGGSPFELDD